MSTLLFVELLLLYSPAILCVNIYNAKTLLILHNNTNISLFVFKTVYKF